MGTLKQRNLAKIILENPQLMREGSKGELVGKGEYSKKIQENPSRVLEAPGFLNELAKLGLTDELITSALVEDIKAKPGKRLGELGLGADIRGLRKREVPLETVRTIVAIQIVQPNARDNPSTQADPEAI